MTRRELKEIIQECIDEINAEESVEDIKEDDNRDLVSEGVIAGLFGAILIALLGPYIIMLAIIIILAPFVIIANKAKEKKVNELITNNPIVCKAIKDFCNKTKDAYKKVCKDKSKYLFDEGNEHYLDKDNFVFGKENGKEVNKIYIPLLGIDGAKIIKELYNVDTLADYEELVNWTQPDENPPVKKEVKEILQVFKEAVKEVNKGFKSVSNNNAVVLSYEAFGGDNAVYNSLCGDAIEDGCYILLTINFSDYKDIKVPEKYKAKFDDILNTMRAKLKLK